MRELQRRLIQAFGLAAFMLSSGCAVKPLDLNIASQGSKLKPVAVKTTKFTIQTLQPSSVEGKVLRVYVEGDGRAWITSRSASDDPTPIKSFAPSFAINDTKPSVYMARPCQYILGPNCKKSVWTSGRFSEENVKAESEVLDALKSQYGLQGFELVGYSGGAAIALLLAAYRTDVVQVQTIAGNLDPQAWTQLKRIAALDGSLNPVDFADTLAKLPQRHFIGMSDTVVPAEVSQLYMLKVQPLCGETVFVDADHQSGFEDSWKLSRNKPVKCER
ncbi:alpha/beta hydrolase [Pseudomonas tritici]|uniref:alpha/beta hydrolase n=1 Tax=Pseudomonas tritici TaxID=2745518 RepID=UPI00387B4919